MIKQRAEKHDSGQEHARLSNALSLPWSVYRCSWRTLLSLSSLVHRTGCRDCLAAPHPSLAPAVFRRRRTATRIYQCDDGVGEDRAGK